MLKCDKCGCLLSLLRVYKKRAFCDNCKTWIGWVIIIDDDCIECKIEHVKHSKQSKATHA